MEIDGAAGLVADVDERVGHLGRGDDDVTRTGLDLLVADGEAQAAGLDDERLLVGVLVETRAVARPGPADEEGQAGAVVGARELGRPGGGGELVDRDDVGAGAHRASHRGPRRPARRQRRKAPRKSGGTGWPTATLRATAAASVTRSMAGMTAVFQGPGRARRPGGPGRSASIARRSAPTRAAWTRSSRSSSS